jgi:hypothetical protein
LSVKDVAPAVGKAGTEGGGSFRWTDDEAEKPLLRGVDGDASDPSGLEMERFRFLRLEEE